MSNENSTIFDCNLFKSFLESGGLHDSGDFDLFANRILQSDTNGSVCGGMAIQLLEELVTAINAQVEHRITYNISSSTTAKDLFTYMEDGNAA